ncbi:MAG: deoxyribose-phosphate aldolase [Microcoleaceae cyanobacterium]
MPSQSSFDNFDITAFVDHTLLNPLATPEQIEQCCDEADRYQFASVCVYPCYVRQAAEFLHHKNPKVSTVIGFPAGATTSATKLYESLEAAEQGATELDVVINLAWVKSGDIDAVCREIAEICQETRQTVKAILETALLTNSEKKLVATALLDAGVAFLKTSTGWHGGATVADIRLLKQVTEGQIGLKASGGIRTYEQAVELVMAGATRLGTSRGLDLLQQREHLSENTS